VAVDVIAVATPKNKQVAALRINNVVVNKLIKSKRLRFNVAFFLPTT
jgi:hypothetical protein